MLQIRSSTLTQSKSRANIIAPSLMHGKPFCTFFFTHLETFVALKCQAVSKLQTFAQELEQRAKNLALEADLRRQLNSPGTAATKERIADPNVAGCTERIEALANLPVPRQLEAIEAGVGNKRGQ